MNSDWNMGFDVFMKDPKNPPAVAPAPKCGGFVYNQRRRRVVYDKWPWKDASGSRRRFWQHEPKYETRWDVTTGEVRWANTTTAPDGKSAGYSTFFDKLATDGAASAAYNKASASQKTAWNIGTPGCHKGCYRKGWLDGGEHNIRSRNPRSEALPTRRHGDPKGVEWCSKNTNYDSKKDLCDQVKTKYDEVEKLEADLYDLYLKKSKFAWYVGHTTQFGWKANKRWNDNMRNANVECGEKDTVLIKALKELAALNEKVAV
jgi:hypothetical protein